MRTLFSTMFIIGCFAVLLGLAGYASPMNVITRYIQREQLPLNELIQTVPPKYGLPSELVAAIVAKESGGRKNAIRFEPSWLPRARKITRNEDDARMWASSHGVGQIAGWWAREFNMSWEDLYDEQTNIELACAILRRNLDGYRSVKDVSKRYWLAVRDYNGSGALAERYANDIMDQLEKEYFKREAATWGKNEKSQKSQKS